MAYLTQTKVVAVLYRLAPEHPFPLGRRRCGGGVSRSVEDV